jgi:hypothetical protein
MTPADEDKRQAAALTVSLSGSLTAGSVAIIGGAAAVSTFVTDKYSVSWIFYAALLVGIGLLAWGVFAGGQAVGKICSEGAEGRWTNTPDKGSFNNQAIGALFGTLVLLVAVGVGLAGERRGTEPSTSQRVDPRIDGLVDRNQASEAELARVRTELAKLRKRVARLGRAP